MQECLCCIHFKDCKGKHVYQKELASAEVACMDSVYRLSLAQLPSLQPINLPPPKFLHLYTNEDDCLTIKSDTP